MATACIAFYGFDDHFGPTSTAKLEAREDIVKQREDLIEEREEAREEQLEESR